MKKVGIMSMQRVNNYGSFLQAYALKKTIENLGPFQVEFVDYTLGPPVSQARKINSTRIKNGLKVIVSTEFRKKRKERSKLNELFQENYIPYLGVKKAYNYYPNLDILVIGSDEVFNCTQEHQSVGYSLDLFGNNNNADRLISYAASFGNTTVEKLEKYNRKEEIFDLLKKFDDISVRDLNSYNIVKESGYESEIHINLDPVLIYDYNTVVKDYPRVIKDDYIILYGYDYRFKKEEIKIIEEFCKTNNKRIICIGGVQQTVGDFIICDPFECLAYFKYADYIITDTFHGTIFSIIFKKQFTTIIRQSKNVGYGNEEKLTYLLGKLKLDFRGTNQLLNIQKFYDEKIDYENVLEILSKERKKTVKYLKKNLQKDE